MGLLSVVILTRLLRPEQYGLLNIFNNAVALILSVVYLGLDSSYIRFYNEPPEEKSSFMIKLIFFSLIVDVSIVLFLVFFRGNEFTKQIFGISNTFVWWLVGLSVASQLILRYLNIIYRMTFQTTKYNIQSVFIVICQKFFVIIASLWSNTDIQLLSINVMGVVFLVCVYIAIQRNDIIPYSPKFSLSFHGYGSVFKYALFAAPLAICVNLNNFFSQQIIVRFLGRAYVGIYSSAGYFSSILSAIQSGFTTFWSAFMYSHYKTEHALIRKVHDYVMFGAITLMFIFICFKDCIYLFIGENYHDSKQFFALVLIYPILSLISETTIYGLTIEKKNYYLLVSYFISIMCNIGGGYFLISKMGLLGIAYANAMSGVLLFSINTIFAQKYYMSILNPLKTIWGLLIILIMALTNTYFQRNFELIFIIIEYVFGVFLYRDIVMMLYNLIYGYLKCWRGRG